MTQTKNTGGVEKTFWLLYRLNRVGFRESLSSTACCILVSVCVSVQQSTSNSVSETRLFSMLGFVSHLAGAFTVLVFRLDVFELSNCDALTKNCFFVYVCSGIPVFHPYFQFQIQLDLKILILMHLHVDTVNMMCTGCDCVDKNETLLVMSVLHTLHVSQCHHKHDAVLENEDCVLPDCFMQLHLV